MVNALAVLFDNFTVGGRETYVSEIVCEFKRRLDLRCGLIAQSIVGSAQADIFDHLFETGAREFGFKENPAWEDFFNRLGPNLIWAQHSEFVNGLALSDRYHVPLLPTFHTPFKEGTVWDDPVLSLGTALVIERCPLLAGVSNEILRSLVELGADKTKLRLLPNRVRMPEGPVSSPNVGIARSSGYGPQVVLLTRPRKYGHIRAAMSFFHALRKRLPYARMAIYCGSDGGDAKLRPNDALSKFKLAKRLVGGRWLAKNLWFLRDLSSIDFHALTDDARSVIRHADIVLGMGRALLEGLSLGKISILIGYQRAIEIVSSENFDRLRFTNLSGRSIEPSPLEKIVTEAIEGLRANYRTPLNILNEIDLSAHWRSYASVFSETVEKWKSSQRGFPNSMDVLNYSSDAIKLRSFDRLLSIANDREIDAFRKLKNLSSKPLLIA